MRKSQGNHLAKTPASLDPLWVPRQGHWSPNAVRATKSKLMVRLKLLLAGFWEAPPGQGFEIYTVRTKNKHYVGG